jgi:hypothetical protein
LQQIPEFAAKIESWNQHKYKQSESGTRTQKQKMAAHGAGSLDDPERGL